MAGLSAIMGRGRDREIKRVARVPAAAAAAGQGAADSPLLSSPALPCPCWLQTWGRGSGGALTLGLPIKGDNEISRGKILLK